MYIDTYLDRIVSLLHCCRRRRRYGRRSEVGGRYVLRITSPPPCANMRFFAKSKKIAQLPHPVQILRRSYVRWIQNRGSFHDRDVKKSVESHTVLNLRRFYVWESKKSLWESHDFFRFRKKSHVCTRRWRSDPQNVAEVAGSFESFISHAS